jgi:hypothetical protein
MVEPWKTFRARDAAGWEYEVRVYVSAVAGCRPVTARRVGTVVQERARHLADDVYQLVSGGGALTRIRGPGGRPHASDGP